MTLYRRMANNSVVRSSYDLSAQQSVTPGVTPPGDTRLYGLARVIADSLSQHTVALLFADGPMGTGVMNSNSPSEWMLSARSRTRPDAGVEYARGNSGYAALWAKSQIRSSRTPTIANSTSRSVHTAFEFVLEFGDTYATEPRTCHTRIVTSPVYALELLDVLERAVRRYESRFGPARDPSQHLREARVGRCAPRSCKPEGEALPPRHRN